METMNKNTLKYILREILIVIVGISIAFSMNKCSDGVKNNRLRKEYLVDLKDDVIEDRKQLASNIAGIEQKIEICNRIIPLLNTESENKVGLLGLVFQVLNYENFDAKNVTYSTLINSGDLRLINSFELKKSIQLHYSNYDKLGNTYEKHRSLIKDYLGNYMINFADYDKMEIGEQPFTDEIRLKNIMRALITTLMEKKIVTEGGVKSCDVLIQALEKF